MLIRSRFSLMQIFSYTWKVDLMLLALCTATYFLDKYWLQSHINIPTAISAVLGTAIAFFIGFNNNQAYDRWWEARTIWGGLVNDSRSWARSLVAFYHSDNTEQRQTTARNMIYRHLAFLYTLKSALRNRPDNYYERYLSPEEKEIISRQTNKPNAILNIQAQELQRLKQTGTIDGFQFIEINELLVRHTDNMGKSERIKNTVFPTSYVYFTNLFIWFYVLMNTLMMTESIGAWSIIFGWAFGFVFHTTHLNGVSLMNPFAYNPLATPLDSITRTIEINLLETLGEKEIPAPVEPRANGLYIM
ncbi:putative membrane protein [Chitinophaga dinghuensis]|uniref:Putative membrane protein n=1 Tax=Chitinophaga dinghuensis TaxID=1539050 RepID=A0A327VLP6_9BACT|nr:bestrophin family ion channel [Chitinophaga dinghuensis]RAJ75680.1 putative membrane protein [Chitinophaga dinghuensis]